MLMGEYVHSIDAKGRVILPVDFRAELGEHFVITKGLDRCLFIFGDDEWAALEEKLRGLPLTHPKARFLERHFFSGGRVLECDRQGRFLVPGSLRSYAKLEKDVVITGVSNRVEVWSKSEWDSYNSIEGESAETIAEMLSDLGI